MHRQISVFEVKLHHRAKAAYMSICINRLRGTDLTSDCFRGSLEAVAALLQSVIELPYSARVLA